MIPSKLWSNVTSVLSEHDCPCCEDLFSFRVFTVALRPAARCTKSRRVSTEWQKGSLWSRAVVVKVSGDYDRCTYVVAVVVSLGRWNWFTGPGVQLNRRPMKILGNEESCRLDTLRNVKMFTTTECSCIEGQSMCSKDYTIWNKSK